MRNYMASVNVVALWTDCDFRKIMAWCLEAQKALRGQPPGTAIVAMNARRTRARVFDSNGNYYNIIAVKGEVFDVDRIDVLVKAMKMRLVLPATVRQADEKSRREYDKRHAA